ncbi:RING-H2 finger protein ATL74-like [Arachis duranensis]|uniref:RING-type E3 ubiquitin transferase n=1 Tax=Arachis duranensis TaxID=130453 RepID=A0A9C6TLY3_ARADU|nr:RING-H2 finger protein ATL74-like [Arachis duranensis]XP_057755625.1 RING-H2 finger protein ATL74-like [Arachis stenosperma]
MAKLESNHTPPPTMSPTISKPCYPPQSPNNNSGGFNLMVILAAIVCAFLCALGLNTMLQCTLQCASRVLTEPLQWIASRGINSGLKKKEMVALPTSIYNRSSPSSGSASCAICLADFSDGDKIRFLPKCNHRFHVACIDKWLLSHSSCPTCRNFLKSNDSSHPFHILIA